MTKRQGVDPILVDTRADFFAAMSGLQAEFAVASADIDAREARLQNALADIRYMLHDGIGETVLTPAHGLARFMTEFNAELAEIVQNWLDRIEKHDRNTAFRNGFTDSLVVFVLGKVKAGKSSLGNYMAYGRSNPEEARITGTHPDFFTAAMAHGEKDQEEAAVGQGGYFRVGARETTKSIQGFRVPGLTWVDSPGLHSVTRENGALASDYADVADLVVYPMHTANPGRAGDIAEIQELLRAKKRFLVVITQCDRLVEDEAPNGAIVQNWLMKDGATRKGQIEYVRHAVSAAGDGAPFDLLTLSVRFAETHDNSPEALEESGIADFFRLLTEIARSEGVRRKCETPSRNLDHFVQLVLGVDAHSDALSVVRVIARLRDLEKKLAAADAEIDRRADRVTAAVFGRIGPAVANQIKRHAGDENQAGFERECTDALRQIVAEEIRTEILSLLVATGGALVQTLNLEEISGFLNFESVTVNVPKSNRKLVGALGKTGGAIAGAAAGARLGALGGPVGVAVGGILGGLIGSFGGNVAGEALGSDWEETMKAGDNRSEVEASAVKAMQDAGQAAVEEFFVNLKRAVSTSVSRRAARLDHELARFSDILKRKVHSNG